MADVAVCCEPFSMASNSLDQAGKIQGIFAISAVLGPTCSRKSPVSLGVFGGIPYSTEQGIILASTGNYFAGTGNFLQIAGKLHEVYPDKSQDVAGMQRFFKQFRRRARIQHIARVRDSLRPPESDHSRDGE